MYKKIVILILALISFILVFVGCGKDSASNNNFNKLNNSNKKKILPWL